MKDCADTGRLVGDGTPKLRTPELLPLGDQAFVLRAEPVIDPEVNSLVLGWAHCLDEQAPAWLVDRVPSYAALVVIYDCTMVSADEVAAVLRHIAERTADSREGAAPNGSACPVGGLPRRVPVWYDPSLAPDLESVAREKRLDVDEVIKLHSEPEYRVYMLGFRPGFPFMGVVDKRLEMPRLSQPRLAVDPGAVAIAGRQTGIYPVRGPGGWRILGRTPLSIFTPAPQPGGRSFMFEPGDRVRFEAIDGARYKELLDANRFER